MYRIILFMVLFCMIPALSHAKVSAKVDRTTIEEGETFQLRLQSDGSEPNLENLKLQFDVLGTSRSSQVSIINGKMQRTNEWVVTLAPKNMGVQVIPSIKFGNESSAPIQVKVIKPVASKAGQGADIFLEAKVDQPSVYVQSQLVYSLRLYRAVEIRDGTLTEPAVDNAVIERLGEDVRFQTQRGQRRYNVTERRYAIFPQQSGTLEFPPMIFQGLVIEPQAQQRSNDPFNRFFQTQVTKRVRIKSESLNVEVKPQAAEFKGDHWLPSKRLILTEDWSPKDPAFKVGEPVTRTLRMEALGLTGSQLPELKMFNAHGVKQYSDQPTVQTLQKGNDLLAVREEKFAIIPTSAGKLVLPEIRLSWWDTEFNKEKTISIPPKIIDVAPAAKSAIQNVAPGQMADVDSAQMGEQEPEAETTIIKTINDPGFWPYITAAFAFAWLVTLVMTFLIWRRVDKSPAVSNKPMHHVQQGSTKKAMTELKQACSSNNPVAAKQAILDWARVIWPDISPRNLEQIAALLHDSTIKQAFADLAQLLYKGGGSDWDGKRFWENVSSRMRQPKITKQKSHKSLPDLYPQQS